MSREPSDATKLRAARSEIKSLKSKLRTITAQAAEFRARATKVEQECAEWKHSFYKLLDRIPKIGDGT